MKIFMILATIMVAILAIATTVMGQLGGDGYRADPASLPPQPPNLGGDPNTWSPYPLGSGSN